MKEKQMHWTLNMEYLRKESSVFSSGNQYGNQRLSGGGLDVKGGEEPNERESERRIRNATVST